ncbi:MAG: hypothetical protein HFE97_05860 [Oscillospiraceae bacterium]|nr:hypothetical protein [Oscillospiraceae bacterium]
MIVTTDLDRTLIFTQKQLTPAPETIPAEYRLGQPAAFMTAGALAHLRTLQRRAVFLVNTMRGLEQANRVVFVGDGSCRYVAVQNGLYLYRDGVEDPNWAAFVRRTVGELPLDLPGGIRRVQTLPGIEALSKQYEYLAVFFVTEEIFDDGICAQLAEELAASGWLLHRQRRKLYLFPAAIDKGRVLDYVQTLEEDRDTVGLGDSWFDLPMLRACRLAYAPKGCELDGSAWDLALRFSAHTAQAGAEELLAALLNRV